MLRNRSLIIGILMLLVWLPAPGAFAGEGDIQLPSLEAPTFLGGSLTGRTILLLGLAICAGGALFGILEYLKTRALPVHRSMAEVSHIIWETCKTYLLQQGKFLAALWLLIAICMVYYFKYLQADGWGPVAMILGCSILGILGSYGVAWFGIRINTTANSRAAFASLRGDSLKTLFIPLQAGMSIGMLLVCVELSCMISILLFIPRELAGPCFIGFAIGESLGASALRIGGGIFTKIADIGSDLMKIVFNLPEDDPKNPGVIADCTGDNAGDSVGPTADGFETYGVTSVALIAFLALALIASPLLCGKLILWLFRHPKPDGAGFPRFLLCESDHGQGALRREKEFQLGSAADGSGLDHQPGVDRGLFWRQQTVAGRFHGSASDQRHADRCALEKPLVGVVGDHCLRHPRGRVDHGIHQDLR
jgi:K(+)-stimulated pyrophosphate-energized sodium pump